MWQWFQNARQKSPPAANPAVVHEAVPRWNPAQTKAERDFVRTIAFFGVLVVLSLVLVGLYDPCCGEGESGEAPSSRASTNVPAASAMRTNVPITTNAAITNMAATTLTNAAGTNGFSANLPAVTTNALAHSSGKTSFKRHSVISLLWALACLVAGGLVGFLFGIPKVFQPDGRAAAAQNAAVSGQGAAGEKAVSLQGQAAQTGLYSQQVNTNLTEISDWITKIIVGLGLIHLKDIPPLLDKAAKVISGGLANCGCHGDHTGFAVALIVFFSVLGFLFGYLMTRLFLAPAFWRADQLEETRQQIEGIKTEQDKRSADVAQIAQVLAAQVAADPTASEKARPAPERNIVRLASEHAAEKPAAARSYQDWYILASDALSDGRYQEAIESAMKALEATPPRQALWGIYNVIGLANHYLQPSSWKLGDNMDWFNRARDAYEKAIEVAQSPHERLLAQANLAFVYLDAEQYPTAEQLARDVRDRARSLAEGGFLADLARIALAAALSKTNPGDAANVLNEVQALPTFAYLFEERDIAESIIKELSAAPNLKPEVRTFLSRYSSAP